MSLQLDPVRRGDVRPLIELGISTDRRLLRDQGAVSLDPVLNDPGAQRFCIRHETALIGYCQLIDLRERPDLGRGDGRPAALIWRFMIGAYYQRRGHGTSALVLVEDWARRCGLEQIFTSAFAFNAVALRFFEGQGYARTGRLDDDEVELGKRL